MIRRIFWVAVTTISELLKDRTITGFFFVGVALIFGGYVIAEMAVVERLKMFIDTGMGAIFVISVFITLMAGSNLLDREIRDREILCVLSKPISRSSWMLGKTLGFLVTIAILIFSLATVLYFYVGVQLNFWRPEIFTAAFFIYLEMIILCNYVVLFSSLTSQYLSIFFGIMVLLIGHMVDDLKLYWDNSELATRVIMKGLYYIMPNLEAYSTAPLLYGKIAVPPDLILSLVVTSVMYLVVATTLSVVILRKKEIA